MIVLDDIVCDVHVGNWFYGCSFFRLCFFFFFFKQKTAYEILTCDWSSDVCSSDLQSFENSAKGVPQENFSISSKFKSPPKPPDMLANFMLFSYLKTVLRDRKSVV